MAARVSAAWARITQRSVPSVENRADLRREQMAGKNISCFDRDQKKSRRKTDKKFP